MAKNRDYHPPKLGSYLPPEHLLAGYLMGENGVQGFGHKTFYVAQVPVALARQIICKFHYSKRVVNNSYLHLGVYIEGALEGVLQFGHSMNTKSCNKIVSDTLPGEYLELNRMWLSDSAPRNSESRAISYSIKYIRLACPMVAWIQSFADERCGCLGVVYQAANFLYIGSHVSPFYELDGEMYHNIAMTCKSRPGIRGSYLRANRDRAKRINIRQFRYIYFLKRDFLKRLNFKIQSYPKRL